MIETSPKESLTHYAAKIRRGEVVAFPTETVYGLGADAWNADAVARIFELKGRPPDNPLIVHVNSESMVETLVSEISDDAKQLMERFWPGPLTIIFPKRPEVLDIVTAGIPTVAIRMPDHPIPLRLISEAGPIAAPSANTSGRPSPTRAEHVHHDFGNEVPVIEGGSCQYGLESTVLDLSQGPYTILRPGHITQSELEQVLKKPVRMAPYHSADSADHIRSGDTPRSPGMKYTHYAPDARVRWMTHEELPFPDPPAEKTLYLLHRDLADVPETAGDNRGSHQDHQQNIQKPGEGWSSSTAESEAEQQIFHYRQDYIEMARDLYDRFRMADLKGFHEVAIEPFPAWHEALEALVNRIRKAIGA